MGMVESIPAAIKRVANRCNCSADSFAEEPEAITGPVSMRRMWDRQKRRPMPDFQNQDMTGFQSRSPRMIFVFV